MEFIDDGLSPTSGAQEVGFEPGEALETIFGGAEVVCEWSGSEYGHNELSADQIISQLPEGVTLSEEQAAMLKDQPDNEVAEEQKLAQSGQEGPDTGPSGFDNGGMDLA